ncbi:MAG: cysteine desulfurase family protein [Patescibacteria group bacterium]
MSHLYFDYAASTPLDPRVKESMDEVALIAGNPSSLHASGRMLREKIDRARRSLAGLLDVDETEIIFTSGATESNVAALDGIVRAVRASHPARRLRIVASAIEHSSVSATLARLQEYGAAVDIVPVAADGRVRPDDVARAITADTVIVCIMWANNVLGAIQPIAEISGAVAEAKMKRGPKDPPLFFVCDAVQAMSTQSVLPRRLGIDALSLSAHKMYGPKGVGALYLKRGTPFAPLITGGGQEAGRRSGTENVAGITGLGRAAEILIVDRAAENERTARLRRALVDGLRAIRGVEVFGKDADSLPGTAFLSGRENGDVLALKLDVKGIAASAGSACDAGNRKKSSALAALPDHRFADRGGVRLSFGRFTRHEEISAVITALREA